MPSVTKSSRWRWVGRTTGGGERFEGRWQGKRRGRREAEESWSRAQDKSTKKTKYEKDPREGKEARLKDKAPKTDWSVFRKKVAKERNKRGQESLGIIKKRREGDPERRSRVKKVSRAGEQIFK